MPKAPSIDFLRHFVRENKPNKRCDKSSFSLCLSTIHNEIVVIITFLIEILIDIAQLVDKQI